MKTPKLSKNFDHQVFDLSVIGTALKGLHGRVTSPIGGFPMGWASAFR
jgi:hypothetical protein